MRSGHSDCPHWVQTVPEASHFADVPLHAAAGCGSAAHVSLRKHSGRGLGGRAAWALEELQSHPPIDGCSYQFPRLPPGHLLAWLVSRKPFSLLFFYFKIYFLCVYMYQRERENILEVIGQPQMSSQEPSILVFINGYV